MSARKQSGFSATITGPTRKPSGAHRTKHGLQVVGKTQTKRVGVKPVALPSMRAENAGLDPNVPLVPSNAPGWGASGQASSLSSSPPTVAKTTTATSGNGSSGQASSSVAGGTNKTTSSRSSGPSSLAQAQQAAASRRAVVAQKPQASSVGTPPHKANSSFDSGPVPEEQPPAAPRGTSKTVWESGDTFSKVASTGVSSTNWGDMPPDEPADLGRASPQAIEPERKPKAATRPAKERRMKPVNQLVEKLLQGEPPTRLDGHVSSGAFLQRIGYLKPAVIRCKRAITMSRPPRLPRDDANTASSESAHGMDERHQRKRVDKSHRDQQEPNGAHKTSSVAVNSDAIPENDQPSVTHKADVSNRKDARQAQHAQAVEPRTGARGERQLFDWRDKSHPSTDVRSKRDQHRKRRDSEKSTGSSEGQRRRRSEKSSTSEDRQQSRTVPTVIVKLPKGKKTTTPVETSESMPSRLQRAQQDKRQRGTKLQSARTADEASSNSQRPGKVEKAERFKDHDRDGHKGAPTSSKASDDKTLAARRQQKSQKAAPATSGKAASANITSEGKKNDVMSKPRRTSSFDPEKVEQTYGTYGILGFVQGEGDDVSLKVGKRNTRRHQRSAADEEPPMRPGVAIVDDEPRPLSAYDDYGNDFAAESFTEVKSKAKQQQERREQLRKEEAERKRKEKQARLEQKRLKEQEQREKERLRVQQEKEALKNWDRVAAEEKQREKEQERLALAKLVEDVTSGQDKEQDMQAEASEHISSSRSGGEGGQSSAAVAATEDDHRLPQASTDAVDDGVADVSNVWASENEDAKAAGKPRMAWSNNPASSTIETATFAVSFHASAGSDVWSNVPVPSQTQSSVTSEKTDNNLGQSADTAAENVHFGSEMEPSDNADTTSLAPASDAAVSLSSPLQLMDATLEPNTIAQGVPRVSMYSAVGAADQAAASLAPSTFVHAQAYTPLAPQAQALYPSQAAVTQVAGLYAFPPPQPVQTQYHDYFNAASQGAMYAQPRAVYLQQAPQQYQPMAFAMQTQQPPMQAVHAPQAFVGTEMGHQAYHRTTMMSSALPQQQRAPGSRYGGSYVPLQPMGPSPQQQHHYQQQQQQQHHQAANMSPQLMGSDPFGGPFAMPMNLQGEPQFLSTQVAPPGMRGHRGHRGRGRGGRGRGGGYGRGVYSYHASAPESGDSIAD